MIIIAAAAFMVVVVFVVYALVMISELKEENLKLHNRISVFGSINDNHKTWVAKVAKMEPMTALEEIRKVNNYNQKAEAQRKG